MTVEASNSTKVSIVIPTKNNGNIIARCLDYLGDINIRKFDSNSDKMAKIEEIKKKYKEEWVLVEDLEEDELGQPTKVELIAHSKSRDEIYNALMETREKYTRQFYKGEIPKKDYVVAFDEMIKGSAEKRISEILKRLVERRHEMLYLE